MKALKPVLFLGVILLVHLLEARNPETIFDTARPWVCRVTYYKNVATQAKIGSYIKIKQNRIGVLVNPSGLVMVSSDVYPLSLDIMSGNGVSFFSGEPSDFKVTLWNGKEYPARFVGKDDLAKVAFIQMTEPPDSPLPFASFVSTDSVTVGQRIYLLELLGEGYNFEPIFTPVRVNAVIRLPRKKFLINDLRTALSAGGLVLNASGHPIGVTLESGAESAGFQSGMDFEDYRPDFLEIAPSEWFQALIQHPPVLVKAGYQGKAWLGIRMQALTPELASYWHVPAQGGVVVDQVFPDSPAEKAGLKGGDVIVAVNGRPITIKRDELLNRFRELIARQKPDNRIELTLFRKGRQLVKTVRLRSAPRAIDLADKYQLRQLGMEVRELTRDILYDYMLPLDTRGVYVYQVDRASPAGLAGLEIGSIITHLNGEPVKDLSDFRKKMERALQQGGKKIMLQVQQRRETAFVFVDIK